MIDLSPGCQAPAEAIIRILPALIDALPNDEQRVMQLRYAERKTLAEIAFVIGATPEIAREIWARSLVRLQSQMRRPT